MDRFKANNSLRLKKNIWIYLLLGYLIGYQKITKKIAVYSKNKLIITYFLLHLYKPLKNYIFWYIDH